MLISEFDYYLPPELIAQEPLPQRHGSRMLVVDRSAQSFSDDLFASFPTLLRDADVLVLNNTKVFPARLFGTIDTGAAVEVFLVREMENGLWETLARPGRRLATGKRIVFHDRLTAEVIQKRDDGKVVIHLEAEGDLFEILDLIGSTPLPPYIKRTAEERTADRDRYQTVFAKARGAIAAPTAGLHFSREIFDRIASLGISIIELTLHVGYGTFEPVRATDTVDHRVAAERFTVTEEAARALNEARAEGRRIVAVGTTTARALESSMLQFGEVKSGSHVAELTITPGYDFKAVGAMLTNFHLPQSSLLILTSTFGGHELIMNAYRHAVAAKYRFYSYGDCMFIA